MAKGDTYSPAQIAVALYNAGFRGANLLKLIAASFAESGGKSIDSPPNKDGSIDRGPFQINDINLNGGLLNSQAYDVNQAAQIAFGIFRKRGSLADWTTITGGAYLAHENEALQGVAALPKDAFQASDVIDAFSKGVTGAIKDAEGNIIESAVDATGIGAVGDFFTNLRKEQILFRIGLTIGASALIVVGLGLYVFGPSSMNPKDSAKTIVKLSGTAAKGAMI